MKMLKKTEDADEFPKPPSLMKRRRPKFLSKAKMSTLTIREDDLSAAFEDFRLTFEATIRWPADAIPIEIFAEIMSYLPRSSIQNMRLANKEFEKKVSSYLFQVVVVPFKPEIYGVAPDPPLGGNRPASIEPPKAILLQDKGMRVFYGFGERIKKFAMSFEFDEEKLNHPPTKNDQEAITSFWGIYPWPYQRYNRYAQLEGLEQTADETKTMAKALRYITGANELGLSIDGGLGWLCGPDVNQRVLERDLKPVVFGAPKYVPEPKTSFRYGYGLADSPSLSSQHNQRYQELRRMCQAAGYHGKALDPAVRLMLENDGSANTLSDDGPSAVERHSVIRGYQIRTDYSEYEALHPNLANAVGVDPNDLYDADDDEGGEGHQVGYRRTFNVNKAKPKWIKSEVVSLKPNDLTIAQKEMLLETEWAQRAFMQSYTIAVIDNAMAFHGVQALTIARLPCRHLPTLRREDFWDALPSLWKLSLAVIPDWRDVAKHPAGWVQDVKLAPSLSVASVYQLLQEQISDRENIKSLHLEWISGGEYSPGMFSRNQHIMPAPIVSKGVDMVDRRQAYPVLRFPHLQHFSLKNCYLTPHIMNKFMIGLKKDGIHSITLNSVSLTAGIPKYVNPNPLANQHGFGAVLPPFPLHAPAQVQVIHAQWQAIQGVNGGQNFQPPPLQAAPAIPVAPPTPTVVVHPPNAEPEWLGPPRLDSWASIIDKLTPGQTIEEIRFAHDFGEKPDTAPAPNSIRKLDFTSCGYLRLPLEFDQIGLMPIGLLTPPGPATIKKMQENDPHMMKSADSLLGIIINHMDSVEIETLQNAFGLTVGWLARGDDRAELVADSEADGIMDAGHGRFDGVITASDPQ